MSQLRMNVAATQHTEMLLDMMEDFNAIEGIPWLRDAARPAVNLLLSATELGAICLLFESEVAVGLESDAAVGYFVMTWGFDLEWPGRDAFLTELYLLPSARGARALHLQVRPENLAAVRLYEGAGFKAQPRLCLTKLLRS